MHYAELQKVYLNDYLEQENKSLMHNSETDEGFVCGWKWLDKFFGYEEEGDSGSKAVVNGLELATSRFPRG
jgi:hypothetical protein